MRLTDKRQSIADRSSHSKSRHSIESKSPPLVINTPPAGKTSKKRQVEHPDKENCCTLNLFLDSATDTPEFSQDPSKFVYNCQQIYALLESVKIERNHQTSLELIETIRDTIKRLGSKKVLASEIQALQNILSNIEKKLGYRIEEKSQIDLHPSTATQHQIEFSLVSNWKQTTGKEVIYTHFSLIDSDDHISMQMDNPKQVKENNSQLRSGRQSQESVSSNVLITDLNLEIEMLDSLLEGKLRRKLRTLHTSMNSQTTRKGRSKRVFY